jgi:hypothetical protein
MHRPDQHETIARTLAVVERRLRDATEPKSDSHMTRLSDVIADIEEVMRLPLEAIGTAAEKLDLPRDTRSHRSYALALLSLAWSDLQELEPGRLQRGYGLAQPIEGWPEARDAVIDAIEGAIARVKR